MKEFRTAAGQAVLRPCKAVPARTGKQAGTKENGGARYAAVRRI